VILFKIFDLYSLREGAVAVDFFLKEKEFPKVFYLNSGVREQLRSQEKVLQGTPSEGVPQDLPPCFVILSIVRV
jgi:hypothetical protein